MSRSNFKNWIFPLIAIVSLVAFCASTLILLFSYSKASLSQKSQNVAEIISNEIKNDIENLVSTINIFSERAAFVDDEMLYSHISKSIIEEYEFVFAVNLVKKDGIIKRVFPAEKNKAALGQNLLARPDVNTYLIFSRDQKRTAMSHRLMTFQKVYAFTLYRPFYDERQNFSGWINVVVDIDGMIRKKLKEINFGQNVSVKINWKGSNTPGVKIGDTPDARYDKYDRAVLNQELEIEVGLAHDPLEIKLEKMLWSIIGISAFLIVFVCVLLVKIVRANNKLKNLNADLEVANSFIMNFSEDLQTPIRLLSHVISHDLNDENVDKVTITKLKTHIDTAENKIKKIKALLEKNSELK